MLSKLKWLVLSLVVVGFSMACNNSTKNKEEHTSQVAKNHDDHDDHHANEAEKEEKLHLNNGKKWIVNDATQVGMVNMQKILIAFAKEKSTDFAKLGEDLGKESQTIINKCDMTGPDHDQLHIVLHPMLTAISGIKEGKQEDVIKMSNLLGKYFSHFQMAKK